MSMKPANDDKPTFRPLGELTEEILRELERKREVAKQKAANA